jgi:diacylglycerol kinase family enzyme
MNRPIPDIGEVATVLGDAGDLVPTRSLEELANAARALADERPPLVAIWGGDGTVGGTLSALVAAYGQRPLPPLCFLPGGTMNCIARCVGARGTAASMLARLLARRRNGAEIPSVERTALHIGPAYGFLFGVGLIPNFLDVYNSGARQGPSRALEVFVMAAPGLFKGKHAPDPFFDPFRARITMEGEVWEGLFTNLSAGGVHCLPLGFRAYTRATERRGAFHFVAHDLKAWGAAYELVSIKLGFGMQRVQDAVVRGVRVELEKKLPFNFDGDTFDPVDRFDLLAGPTVTLLLP